MPSNDTAAAPAAAPSLPTGIHWNGDGWYAIRVVRGIEIYYHLGPRKGLTLEDAQAKAGQFAMSEPIHVMTKGRFTYVY